MPSNNLVVALSDTPEVRSGAEALANIGDRRLEFVDPDLHRLIPILKCFGGADGSSVCLVAGSVASAQSPNCFQLADLGHVINAMRSLNNQGMLTRWGLVAAATPKGFQDSIERLTGHVRQSERARVDILMMPRDGPPWEVSPFDPNSSETSASAEQVGDQTVQVVSSSAFPTKQSEVLNTRYSAIFVEGHGRSYCVNEGIFCGGGPLKNGESKDSPCLARYDCASGRHLRIGVSNFEADFLVMDACEAGSVFGPACRLNDLPISIKLLENVTAVVASDIAVVRENGWLPEIAALARQSRSLGEFVANLNDMRRRDNPPMPYHLLGDPEAACPVFSEIFNTTEQSVKAAPPSVDHVHPRWVCDAVRSAIQGISNLQSVRANQEEFLTSMCREVADLSRRIETLAWPHELWSTESSSAELANSPCPQCGAEGGTKRTYQGFDGPRSSFDCQFCRLAFDRPEEHGASLRLTVRDELRLVSTAGHDSAPRVAGTVTAGVHGVIGALALSTGIANLGASVSPDVRMIAVQENQTQHFEFQLSFDHADQVSQIYFLKCVGLLNGRLHLACAPISFDRAQRRSEAA